MLRVDRRSRQLPYTSVIARRVAFAYALCLASMGEAVAQGSSPRVSTTSSEGGSAAVPAMVPKGRIKLGAHRATDRVQLIEFIQSDGHVLRRILAGSTVLEAVTERSDLLLPGFSPVNWNRAMFYGVSAEIAASGKFAAFVAAWCPYIDEYEGPDCGSELEFIDSEGKVRWSLSNQVGDSTEVRVTPNGDHVLLVEGWSRDPKAGPRVVRLRNGAGNVEMELGSYRSVDSLHISRSGRLGAFEFERKQAAKQGVSEAGCVFFDIVNRQRHEFVCPPGQLCWHSEDEHGTQKVVGHGGKVLHEVRFP